MSLPAFALSLSLPFLASFAISLPPHLHRDTTSSSNPTPFSPGFPLDPVISLATSLPSHSWEFGTAIEALLELYTPSASVFSTSNANIFPPPYLSVSQTPALSYALQKIVINTPPDGLSPGDGATGDPASLGVGAVLLGAGDWTGVAGGPRGGNFWDAAGAEIEYLLTGAPRWSNGAISQRAQGPELWADFMYMAPPFLAYFAAATTNASLLQESVRQCSLYRTVLQPSPPAGSSQPRGLWQHIVGPFNADPGLWSTGNAWAAAGMARVLAVVMKAPFGMFPGEDAARGSAATSHGAGVLSALSSLSLVQGVDAFLDSIEYTTWLNSPARASPSPPQTRAVLVATLTGFIKEILDGVLAANLDGGLVRNYIDDISNSDGRGFGEVSGSALLASTAYRMSVLVPNVFNVPDVGSHASRYVKWAESIRTTLGVRTADGRGFEHVSQNGTAVPTVNPLGWGDTQPWTAGSPEGQNFVVLMYSAWRDCVLAGVGGCVMPS